MPGAYLHPSQRHTKTGQIGPSSHKNQFHAGVLEGNWFEERFSFGEQPQKSYKFTAKSVQSSSYPEYTTEQMAKAKLNEAPMAESSRTLLFGHGGGDVSHAYHTVTELSYRDLSKEPEALKTNAMTSTKDVPSVASIALHCEASTRKKGESGLQPMNGTLGKSATASDRFITTKNATFDATAEHMKEHPVKASGPTSRRGQLLKSLADPMRKTGLRE